MRRFKKKMLGWLTPKVYEDIYLQHYRVHKAMNKIKGKVVSIDEITKNITRIRYEKVQ